MRISFRNFFLSAFLSPQNKLLLENLYKSYVNFAELVDFVYW